MMHHATLQASESHLIVIPDGQIFGQKLQGLVVVKFQISCKNAENLVASTLNLLRHGGLERVTDDDDDDEITESHGLIKRWLWKMVLVTSVSEEGTL